MNDSTTFLKVKDHSVSGEEFQLIQNKTYGFLETSPQPEAKRLSDYYKTEDYISHTDSKRNLFEKNKLEGETQRRLIVYSDALLETKKKKQNSAPQAKKIYSVNFKKKFARRRQKKIYSVNFKK